MCQQRRKNINSSCTLLVNTKEVILNIKQFAETHNIKYEAVSMYISRHKELFEGHIIITGKYKILDNEAIKILEKQYPPNIRYESIENKEFDNNFLNFNLSFEENFNSNQKLSFSKSINLL